MSVFRQGITWATGIAIFSMFFGAGNVVFPLRLGELAGDQIGYALVGLLLSGIGAPVLGLFATILFEGDYRKFVSRIGRIPGAILILILIAAIGPFAAMPRCLTVSYEAMASYLPLFMSPQIFNVLSGLLILLCVVKRQWVLPILGEFLSPLLLVSLGVVIVKGLMTADPIPHLGVSEVHAFKDGLLEGYQTMDLLASNVFAVGVWVLLKEKLQLKDSQSNILVSTTIAASLIGGGLLAIVYIGLSLAGSMHVSVLQGMPQAGLLSTLSNHVLGEQWSIIANVAMALACFTTVVSLAVTLAEVLPQEFPRLRLSRDPLKNYNLWIMVMVVITVLMANLGFDSIAKFVIPLVQICYPAIIVLTICNILYQLYGFKYVKIPVYATLALTLILG